MTWPQSDVLTPLDLVKSIRVSPIAAAKGEGVPIHADNGSTATETVPSMLEICPPSMAPNWRNHKDLSAQVYDFA